MLKMGHPEVTNHLDIHLYPIFVDCDNPLHSGGVREWEEESLPEDLVYEVNIVSGTVQYVPHQVTRPLHVGLVLVHVRAVLADVRQTWLSEILS